MRWSTILCVAVITHGGVGVTKTSGIPKFWSEDYKIFEQIYGRTSDKHLYGSTLPPSVTYGITGEQRHQEASEKKERVVDNVDNNKYDSDAYGFDDYYTKYLAKQSLNIYENPKTTPAPLKFITYSDFKPISKTTDPEMYNYFKHLEQLEKRKIELSQRGGGFKPYIVNSDVNSEETNAYKNIQNILDAHEANSEAKNVRDKNQNKYDNYYGRKDRRKKPTSFVSNNSLKSKCLSSRCKNRVPNLVRVRTRPFLRK